MLPPSPPASPSIPPQIAALSAEINAATLKSHASLNQMIMQRLPLALPPHSANPNVLAQGLFPFAQIYLDMEAAFASPPLSTFEHAQSNESHHRHSLLLYIRQLYHPRLARSHRLRADLKYIENTFSTEPTIVQSTGLVEDRRQVERFRRNPHLLLAHAWVMYMAIFSGGRWIRSQLESVPQEFWLCSVSAAQVELQKISTEHSGISFLYFDGSFDGQDVKNVFKFDFDNGAHILTAAERGQVIDEAKRLFSRCIEIIRKIDRNIDREGKPKLAWEQSGYNLFTVVFVLALLAMIGRWTHSDGLVEAFG